jgi:hypothetical protein
LLKYKRELEEKLRHTREAIDRVQKDCGHEWDDIKYDPIDNPHLGVISSGQILDNLTPRWHRTCKLCCKTETTLKFITRKEPDWE